jgi:hypothetical protein
LPATFFPDVAFFFPAEVFLAPFFVVLAVTFFAGGFFDFFFADFTDLALVEAVFFRVDFAVEEAFFALDLVEVRLPTHVSDQRSKPVSYVFT